MARPFNFAEDEYYHLYNRGTDRREIFSNEADYRRFKSLLFITNSKKPVDLGQHGSSFARVVEINRGEPLTAIGAYCLMPNHFHILVREVTSGGISKFMQKLTTGYTMYFNLLNKRTGTLFEGTFKAEHVDGDEYLKYLFAYIHLNPAKLIDPQWRESGMRKEIEDFTKKFPHSSYQDYLGERIESAILTKPQFPEYFLNADEFEKEMTEWLHFND